MESLRESILERAKHKREKVKRVHDIMMQSKERKDNLSNAVDADLVVTESNETKSERHVLSTRSKNDTHTTDADINFVNDKQPMVEVDRNTTPESTDMSHKEGKIDQNANAKKYGQNGQILNETSNEANIKREINVLETRNIDLERSVARLLAENEKLNKENEHLKQTYKDLSDSIKKTSVQTKDHVDSLIVQPNFTPPYLPKVRESALAKPHHVNAPSSSRNSQKES
uniref:Uncharacterized protein n=1 Tax=Tanacetum cinerariifolium TaxID=118510 RepID=A0A6L2NMR9_TANCI|nr:hypothetical protein [Tanacetum cinerariifolium]